MGDFLKKWVAITNQEVSLYVWGPKIEVLWSHRETKDQHLKTLRILIVYSKTELWKDCV